MTVLPEQILRELEAIQAAEQADRETTVRRLLTRAIRDWKLEHNAQAYAAGKIGMARAAQESGVTLWEMMEYARSRKIGTQYDRNDLEEDLKEIYRRLGKRPRGQA